MARRRSKRRTHVPDPTKQNPSASATVTAKTSLNSAASRTPKTMIIRTGATAVGPSVSHLVRDMRKVMEPYTASRLRERKSNKVKDFTTMAGPLGVTQILMFSRSESGNVTLRILRTPRGPTLHFKVLNYSLCKDIVKGQRHGGTRTTGKEYLNPPLLVMSNLVTPTTGKPANHEFLTQSMFQSMLPAISAQTISLKSVKRVLLLNRDLPADQKGLEEGLKEGEEYVVDLRHYSITTRPTGVPRAIRKLNRATQPATRNGHGTIPNLGGLEDISEYLLDPSATAGGGYTSESEVDTDAEVEVALPGIQRSGRVKKEVANAGGAEKQAVKLQELGPRMRLQLIKIEEGTNDGKILWHSFVKKSRGEEQELERRAKQRLKLKEERRRVQEENVQRKKKSTAKAGEGDGGGQDELEKETGWSGDEDIWTDEEMQEDSEQEAQEDSDEEMEE
ncbi:hypothetical protein DRE_03382 [Drechslerella stenobrocha 248]|uniref:Brix domain-containing protein n=1 Tax=Drechslerella stenobrocha 248 TaxID=1043628 RepID=W7I512_9PEZI|nr:hypothetical protein DRE_03382 [Drechslerella stenobrocha 248]